MYIICNSIIGTLPEVTNLTAKVQLNCSNIESVTVEWEPPPTLDIPQLEADIIYDVIITYMGIISKMQTDNNEITVTIANIDAPNVNCEKILIAVIPDNTAGQGQPSYSTSIRIKQGLIILIVLCTSDYFMNFFTFNMARFVSYQFILN